MSDEDTCERFAAGSSSTSRPRSPNHRRAFATARSGRCRVAAVAITNAGPSPAAAMSARSCGSLPRSSSAPPTSASGPALTGRAPPAVERSPIELGERVREGADRALDDRVDDEDRLVGTGVREVSQRPRDVVGGALDGREPVRAWTLGGGPVEDDEDARAALDLRGRPADALGDGVDGRALSRKA